MQILSFYFYCYAHWTSQWKYTTRCTVCLLCIVLSLSFTVTKSKKFGNKNMYFMKILRLHCRSKEWNTFQCSRGIAETLILKHPGCNISNSGEGMEIRAYLRGCIVYSVFCWGWFELYGHFSREPTVYTVYSYQCSTGSCVAFWSSRCYAKQIQ